MTAQADMDKAREIIQKHFGPAADYDTLAELKDNLTEEIARALSERTPVAVVPPGWQLSVGEQDNDIWLWLRGPEGSCSLKVPRLIEGQETVRGTLLRSFGDALAAAPPAPSVSAEDVVKATIEIKELFAAEADAHALFYAPTEKGRGAFTAHAEYLRNAESVQRRLSDILARATSSVLAGMDKGEK